eukprot:gene4748-4922_t
MNSTRLLKEFKDSQRPASDDFRLVASPENLHKWQAIINGPQDTPYLGGRFVVDIQNTHAVVPPVANFRTKIFHPNVAFNSGEICLDILKMIGLSSTTWSPAWTINSVAVAILALMSHPEADSPLNCDA